jgi:hypothetical protein
MAAGISTPLQKQIDHDFKRVVIQKIVFDRVNHDFALASA